MPRNNTRTGLGEHPRGPLISTTVAGQVLMLGPERVRQLARAGWFASQGGRGAHAVFHLLDVVHGYLRFRDDEKKRGSKTAAQSDMTRVKAREIQLRVASREGHLMEVEEALEFVDNLMGTLRQSFAGLPARVTRDLQMRRTIETAVNDILATLADIATKKSSAMGARRTASASLAPDDAGQVGGDEQNASTNKRRTRAA